MYICMCNVVTDGQIRGAVENGITDWDELQKKTLVSTRCGKCEPSAREIFDAAIASLKKKIDESADDQGAQAAGICPFSTKTACPCCPYLCEQGTKRDERTKHE